MRFVAGIGAALALCSSAAASHLVTGNGHGFAVVAPEKGIATSFYPHPYSYIRQDPAKPLSEGIETPNFIKTLGWGEAGRAGVTEYIADSHVIRMRRAGGSGYFFMPFGLERPALVIAGPAASPWHVEWNKPLRSRKTLSAGAQLLWFEGIDEPLLLIPLGEVRKAPRGQPLAASPAWAWLEDDSRDWANALMKARRRIPIC